METAKQKVFKTKLFNCLIKTKLAFTTVAIIALCAGSAQSAPSLVSGFTQAQNVMNKGALLNIVHRDTSTWAVGDWVLYEVVDRGGHEYNIKIAVVSENKKSFRVRETVMSGAEHISYDVVFDKASNKNKEGEILASMDIEGFRLNTNSLQEAQVSVRGERIFCAEAEYAGLSSEGYVLLNTKKIPVYGLAELSKIGRRGASTLHLIDFNKATKD